MFLFEKSVIGTYCNRLYDIKASHRPFSCYGGIKANSAGKNNNVTIINTKKGMLLNRFCSHKYFYCEEMQLHKLIPFKSARVIMCPAGVKMSF